MTFAAKPEVADAINRVKCVSKNAPDRPIIAQPCERGSMKNR